MKITTRKLFVEHDFCAWLLGQKPTKKYKKLYYAYSIFLNVIFLIGFPIHLVLGLFQFKTAAEIASNLVISSTCILATLKSYIIWWHLNTIKEIDELMQHLDKRAIEPEDIQFYMDTTWPAVRHIAHLFYFLSFGIGITSELAVVAAGLFGHWELMYPAYHFFDPYDSTLKFTLSHLYELISFYGHIVQNFINDTYGAMCVAIIVGHLRLLGRRIARIGWDKTKTLEQNNEELIECIKDHKIILTFHKKLMQIVSIPLLLQVLFASLIMCLVIVEIMFFEPDAFELVHFSIFLFGLSMQIYPCCYYASKMEFEFENFTRVIYECNWMDQNKAFKSNFRIFGEYTLRAVAIDSGGFFRVNLTAFIGSCKMAYSLFTMLSRMK